MPTPEQYKEFFKRFSEVKKYLHGGEHDEFGNPVEGLDQSSVFTNLGLPQTQPSLNPGFTGLEVTGMPQTPLAPQGLVGGQPPISFGSDYEAYMRDAERVDNRGRLVSKEDPTTERRFSNLFNRGERTEAPTMSREAYIAANPERDATSVGMEWDEMQANSRRGLFSGTQVNTPPPISRADFIQEQAALGISAEQAGADWDKTYGTSRTGIPPISGVGSNLETELFMLGRALGNKDAFGAITSGGAALFGGARDVLSGVGYSKANKSTQDFIDEQRLKQKYTNAPQYKDANSTGGTTYAKYGGLFKMEDGGDIPPQEVGREEQMVAANQQGQEEAQGGVGQIMQQVAQALQGGANPEEVVGKLIETGVPQEQAVQIVQQVIQQLQGGSQEQEVSAQEDEPTFNYGGTYKKVGDYIEFEYGGTVQRGKIKKIKDGQIYL